MASAKTPLEQQVDAIAAALSQNRADFLIGEESLRKTGPPRRVVFVPREGQHQQPETRGNLEVEANKSGRPFTMVPLIVEAHIVAESHPVCWVLWQNVLNASRDSLKTGSVPLDVDMNPPRPWLATGLTDRSEYIVQVFEWTLHTFRGIIDLPLYNGDLLAVADLTDMQVLEDFTTLVDDPIPE